MLAAAIYILNFSVEGRNGSASIPQKAATLVINAFGHLRNQHCCNVGM